MSTNENSAIEQEVILTREEKTEIIEAMLFAAGYPVEIAKIAEILTISEGEVKEIVYGLHKEYENSGRGIQLVFVEDSCQLCTKEKHEGYVRRVLGIRQSGKLSNSCLEVLAVIAYNQPITKAIIDDIRGVDSGYAIGVLSEKNLIESKGRLDAIGKPNLYGTTEDFLRVFGLSSLDELPPSGQLSENEQIKIDI